MLARMIRTSLAIAVSAGALLAAGCGAKEQTTSSTTSAAPPPAPTATETPTPTPTATETPSPSPSPTPTAAAGPKLTVDADPSGQLKYSETTLTAKAGNTTIDFDNKASVPHNVAIRKGTGDPIVETKTVSGGATTANVKLKAGTYEFYCSVPGHKEAGMKGTLTVR